MKRAQFYASVYWIIRNDVWKILLSKRWKQASWFIWRYQIPSWHMDWGESIFEALKREMKEELVIDINEKDVELIYTSHRLFEDWREYFDFYFEIDKYWWKITIWEPEKCDDLKYVSNNDFDLIKLLKHDLIALENIDNWIKFSDFMLKNNEY